MEPQNQDYLIGAGDEAARHRGNLLVDDLISLNTKLCLLSGQEASKDAQTSVAKHIVSVIHDGSTHSLPSNFSSTESFLTGGGRFLKKEGDSWTEISDNDAVELLSNLIVEEVEMLDKAGYGKEEEKDSDKDDEAKEGEEGTASPKKRQKTNSGEAAAAAPVEKSSIEERAIATKPAIDDIVLVDRKDSTEKTYVDHAGNALLVLEVSQFFTDQYMLSKAIVKGTRADAALATAFSLLGPVKDVGGDGTTATKTRFLLRPQNATYLSKGKKEITETWEVLNYTEAAEFILMLLFDKLVDKENIAATLARAPPPEVVAASDKNAADPTKIPIKIFTDHDVLFGRGGLTNSHPGNRRFRDIILLHRPDYVRAIKIEKPNVARRIVRAIRCSDPPGRFLKKDAKNQMWYDVGDRHAAEKTSQALREKTQAEKAARFDEDKRKRLREGGLSQLASQRGVRNYPVLPLPALSPADLQKMVQGAFVPQMNMTGVPMMGPMGPFVPPVPVPPPNGVANAKAKASPKSTKSPAAGAASIGGDMKEAANQDRLDAEGNILVTDADVIAGRGGRSNHHEGNKRFRDIVALHRADYVRAAKVHKPAVARMIVRALRNSDPPGRFLKKDDKTGEWYDIGDKRAAEKCSQALREKSQEERDRQRQEAGTGMPPSYFTNTALFQATAAMIKNGIPGLASPVPASPAQGTEEGAKAKTGSTPGKKGEKKQDAVEATAAV